MKKKTAGKAKGKSSKVNSKTGGGVSAKLKGLASNWNDGLDNPLADFVNWEDGLYHVQLVHAELCESAAGRLQVKFELKDMDGENDNNHMFFDGLDTETSEDCLKYLQKHIRQFGFEPPKNLNKLEDVLATMVKGAPEVSVKLVTKGEFQNTYIQNLIED